MPKATKTPTTRNAVVALHDDPVAHPYDGLPFVVTPGKGERIFWAPRPTGDYNFDCSLGAEYADAAIPMIGDDGTLLRYIVLGILAHGDRERDRGIIVGFFGRLSERLIVGPARRLAAIRDLAAPG
jgi:hypothetical protein